MPAATWFDFEKDILYLSMDFCYLSLDDRQQPGQYLLPNPFRQGWEGPCGYFYNDLKNGYSKCKGSCD